MEAKATKVIKTQTYIDSQATHQVCKGKLVCGDIGSFSKLMNINETRGKLRPLIISHDEQILEGDARYHLADMGIAGTSKEDFKWLSESNTLWVKILALPEEFTDKQIQAIVDGKLKDQSEVFIECETKINDGQIVNHGHKYCRTGRANQK